MDTSTFLLLSGDGTAAAPAFAGRIRVDGRFFVNDAGTFRPLWASCLSHWMDPGRDAVLDEIAERFNGFRIFAGDLGWAGQTPGQARAALPGLLSAARDRGLYVYVCALTGAGYDVAAHLASVAAICAQFDNSVLEVANEIGHPSQSDLGKDPARLLALARHVIPPGVTWTLGASVEMDEPTPEGTYPTTGGLFNDAHLDRGRDTWDQVRRLREIENLSSVTRKPAMSGEPIGAAEQAVAGRRRNDPPFFFALGVLSRGFEIGTVFHSDSGLQGQRLGPTQAACADAFVSGWQAIPTDARLSFVNAGWPGSPVTGADFDHGLTRAYSFVAGATGWTVLLGLIGDPRVVWGGGWYPVGLIAERPGVQVIEIAR